MKVKHLDHYNIRTSVDIITKVKDFYINILGFTEGFRPTLDVDGSWLYINDVPLVHLTVAEKPANIATGALHHISLHCEGLIAYRRMFKEKGINYEVGQIPQLDIIQLFIHDPSGLCVELSFIGEKFE